MIDYDAKTAAVLMRRNWILVPQDGDTANWRHLMDDVRGALIESSQSGMAAENAMDRAVIGAYCPILHAACSDDGSERQQRAFEELWQWVYPRARRRVDTDQDAEDVAQQVMLQVYPKLHQVTDPRGFLAWVNTITFHTLSKHYDRQGRRSQLEWASIDSEEDSDAWIELAGPDDFQQVELAIAEEELVHMIYECMPEGRRRRRAEVLVALALELLKVPEVAEMFETTPANVNLLYFRARKDLREHCPQVMQVLFQYLKPSKQAKQAKADS